MALQTITQTEEQTSKDNSQKEALANSIKESVAGNKMTSKILEDLGLSPEKPKEEEQKKAPVQEEELEEGEAETLDDEGLEAEEVIPKSKVQKRFDAMTAQLKAQQQELDELKSSRPETKDEIKAQLEEMTKEQLKSTRLEVRRALRTETDNIKIRELESLEDKIEDAIQTIPERFRNSQERELQRAARRIEANSDYSAEDGKKILKIAADIYNDTLILQRDIKGQATALEMAVKYFKAISSIPKAEKGDKSKESDLTRQVNTLKRKTMLDTKTSKGNNEQANLDKLKKDAMHGTFKQKLELVKTHPAFNIRGLIPDEYLS